MNNSGAPIMPEGFWMSRTEDGLIALEQYYKEGVTKLEYGVITKSVMDNFHDFKFRFFGRVCPALGIRQLYVLGGGDIVVQWDIVVPQTISLEEINEWRNELQ